MPTMLMLSAADVRDVFDLPTAIASQLTAFAAMGEGTAQLAPRLLLERPDDGSVAFCYAARLSAHTGPVCKFGSVNPGNAGRGLPDVSATVLVLDPETGQPVAVIDGTALTTLRTSAATAVAAQALTRSGSRTLAVFGCGVQGEAHVRALAHVLPLAQVRLWAPDATRRSTLAATLARELDLDVVPAASPEAAVRNADVVVTCTSSRQPVFASSWLADGSTVLSIGSFSPDRCETDRGLIARAGSVVVDDVPTACDHAGPVVAALADGSIDRLDLVPLGDVIAGHRPGRDGEQDVVYYNSVGIGVQDAAAAWAIVQAAHSNRRGRELALCAGGRALRRRRRTTAAAGGVRAARRRARPRRRWKRRSSR